MSARAGYAWRLAALWGLVLGLAASVLAGREAQAGAPALVVVALAVVATRPRSPRSPVAPWVALVGAVAAVCGLALGAARLGSIDSGAFVPPEGQTLVAAGTIVSTPRISAENARFTLELPEGRIGVESGFLPDGVDEGRRVVVKGTVRAPAPWEERSLAGDGVTRVLAADEVEATSSARGGLRGALDDVRRRAEDALERGTPEPSAALLRGFVLGQDDRIADDVRDEFRRSGLAHVLAVSGQNVMLLALLTLPILALAGVPIRARLVAIAGVIAIYVPVAGAGASIQRAGVMGVAGLVAALAGRPRARWYALGLAAAVTLLVDPRASADIGWQLSFAAVAGLLILVQPMLAAAAPPEGFRSPGRRALAEGAAMTLAATLATGPLVAHHFGTVSLTALPANLLALPAIAPAMWLGMLSGALGQIPGAPVEPLTWLGGLFAGYIGWVARVLGGDWAQLEIPEPDLVAAIAWSVAAVGAARLVLVWLGRRDGLRAGISRPCGRARWVSASVVAVLALVAAFGGHQDRDGPLPGPRPDLLLTILDVGQGDAILLQPRGRDGVLVDAGPPEADVGERLDDLGVERLEAVVITHDQRDHAGGLGSVLDQAEVDRLLVGEGEPIACRYLACPPVESVSAGDVLRLGRLRVKVHWPPRNGLPADDPNATSLVLNVELGHFDALLTGDAEAELAPFPSGPVELLKVAHHGSADAGLAALLVRASPELAVISVGSGNSYGHPAPETLSALAAAGVPAMRTDQAGEIRIDVSRDGWGVE